MISMIFAALMGAVFTLVAIENNQAINISFFGNSLNLPLYLTLAMAFLFGAFVSVVFSIFDWSSATSDIRKKQNIYNNAMRINEQLRANIQKLERENGKLKQEINIVKSEFNEWKSKERKENVKNFFQRLTHPNSPSASHA